MKSVIQSVSRFQTATRFDVERQIAPHGAMPKFDPLMTRSWMRRLRARMQIALIEVPRRAQRAADFQRDGADAMEL